MPRSAPARQAYYARRRSMLLSLCALAVGACSTVDRREAPPPSGTGGVNRRTQLWRTPRRQPSRRVASRPAGSRPATSQAVGTRPAATRPALPPLASVRPVAMTRPASSQPAETREPLAKPYRINTANVVRMAYLISPLVIASREDMMAARHGLEEFRANLSRLEPYIGVDGGALEYPQRRGVNGYDSELVAGIQQETFDGSVFRVEGGVNGSRYSYDRTQSDAAKTESGSSGVLRARVEIPFIGSRKRQDRTIKQAYQESSARQAMLEYLRDYRTYVNNALAEYRQTILYLNQMRAYEDHIAAIEALWDLPELTDDERTRLQTALGDAKVHHSGLQASYWSSLLSLLETLGIQPGEKYTVEEPKELSLQFLDEVSTPEGRQRLLAKAFENNPRFAVLEDAIRNAELKRSQAVLGTHDMTAYFEGAHYPFAPPEFDDRVHGWLLTAGITVRINDRRVLTESRKKAEAEIRAYRAQIAAEENDIRDQITIRADRLLTYSKSRSEAIENVEQARAQFQERCEAYFWRGESGMNIDDVLRSLSVLTNAQVQLASNFNQIIDAEHDLLVATGEVYRLVGIRIEKEDSGTVLHEALLSQPSVTSSQPE